MPSLLQLQKKVFGEKEKRNTMRVGKIPTSFFNYYYCFRLTTCNSQIVTASVCDYCWAQKGRLSLSPMSFFLLLNFFFPFYLSLKTVSMALARQRGGWPQLLFVCFVRPAKSPYAVHSVCPADSMDQKKFISSAGRTGWTTISLPCQLRGRNEIVLFAIISCSTSNYFLKITLKRR